MHDLRHDPTAPETPPAPRDLRTLPEMVMADVLPEILRLVDAIQTLSLRQDVFEEELAARRGVVDARLQRLEDSLKRIADAVQILALKQEGKGQLS